MKIKICGLTNNADATSAYKFGADYLGAVVYEKSKRYVPVEELSKVFANIPANIKRVGVFVNAPIEIVRQAVELGGLDVVQCHGNESAEYMESIDFAEVWAARSVNSTEELKQALALPAAMLLIDSVGGGSGKVCDWSYAQQLSTQRKLFLAGGLTPENVASGIAQVAPFGVDVAGGVEACAGKKDLEKLEKFIINVRNIK